MGRPVLLAEKGVADAHIRRHGNHGLFGSFSKGVAKASPGAKMIAIASDGGIQVNIQYMDTAIVQYQFPVKIIALNNGSPVMVHQFQDMYFGHRQECTMIDYGCYDHHKFADDYGTTSLKISSSINDKEYLKATLQKVGPASIEVMLERDTCVNPKFVADLPIEDMSPNLTRDTLKREILIEIVEEGGVPK